MCLWLKNSSAGFCAEIVIQMETSAYPPKEQIFPDECMYVLKIHLALDIVVGNAKTMERGHKVF
jgi:hypothetical protein